MANDQPLPLEEVELLAKYGATYPWMPQQTLKLAKELEGMCPHCRSEATGDGKCYGPSLAARMLGFVVGDFIGRGLDGALVHTFFHEFARRLDAEKVPLDQTTVIGGAWMKAHPFTTILAIDPISPLLGIAMANEYLHHGVTVDEFLELVDTLYHGISAMVGPAAGNA